MFLPLHIIKTTRLGFSKPIPFPCLKRVSLTAMLLLLTGMPAYARPGNTNVTTSPAASAKENLKKLIPARASGWKLLDLRVVSNPSLMLEAAYTKEDLPYRVALYLGYGPNSIIRKQAGEYVQKARAANGLTKRQQKNRTYLLMRDSMNKALAIATFSVDMAALFMTCGEARDCVVPDLEAAEKEILALYGVFDIDRLAALRTGKNAAAGVPSVPSGYDTFVANWPSGRIAVPYPEGWTAVDLDTFTGFLQAVSFVKNPRSVDALYGKGSSISTEDTVRLVSSDNAIVTVGLTGAKATSAEPLDMLKAMCPSEVPVAAAELMQPAAPISVSWGEAAMLVVRGRDADGHAVVSRQLMLERDGRIVSISAYFPPEHTDAMKPVLQTLLKHISFQPN